MSKRNPYGPWLKSRNAMTEFILKSQNRRSYDHKTFPFCYNVKVYDADYYKPPGEYKLSEKLDGEWAKECESGSWVYDTAIEDACRYYPREWCSYPGNDQGEWNLGFYGRSGGWLCLEEWRGQKFAGLYEEDLLEFLQGLSFKDLRAFYIGIDCMNQDFTRRKAKQNIEYAVNFIRGQWEEAKKEEQEARDTELAESIADSRPDLAPQYGS